MAMLKESTAGLSELLLCKKAYQGVFVGTVPRNYCVTVNLDYEENKTYTFHMTQEDSVKLRNSTNTEQVYLVEVEDDNGNYEAWAKFTTKPKQLDD